MSIRNGSRCAAAVAIGYVLSIVVSTLPALGRTAAADELATAGTLAWLGCWRLDEVAEGDEAPEPADTSQLLCLERGEGPSSLSMRAIVDGEVVAQELLIADGSRQSVGEDGCSGWKRSMLSKDQRRLYRQSETTCQGGGQSKLSGASLIVSNDHWVDINVTRVAGEHERVVRHYRKVDAGVLSKQPLAKPAYALGLLGEIPSAAHSARIAAAVPLEADDVIEALEELDPAVVEALLVESGSSFAMDSRLLLRLDDAGVPGQIIDLMMALSYPHYFAVQDETVVTQPVVYSYYWSPWFYGHGYGYGYFHDYAYAHPHHDSDSRPRPKGKVVSGRGYTRVKPVDMPSGGILSQIDGTGSGGGGGGGGGAGGGASSGSTSGSGSSANKSGYKSSNSGSTRRAVRK
jgi:hypothetical protein